MPQAAVIKGTGVAVVLANNLRPLGSRGYAGSHRSRRLPARRRATVAGAAGLLGCHGVCRR